MSRWTGQGPARFIVKERSYEGLTKRVPFRNKRLIAWGPWKAIARFSTLEAAQSHCRARSVGIFERCVFYRGRRITDATTKVIAFCDKPLGATAEGVKLTCVRWFGHFGVCNTRAGE